MNANSHPDTGLELERARHTRFTSPLGGEVGSRSDPGEGERAYGESLAPSPQPSPPRGEGARLHMRHCSLLTHAPKGFHP